MNVARTRRRLIAARRHAARQLISGQRPVPDWGVLSTPADGGSALRAIRRLAGRKEARASRAYSDASSDCQPARCECNKALIAAGYWYDTRYAAEARLRPPKDRDPQHPRKRNVGAGKPIRANRIRREIEAEQRRVFTRYIEGLLGGREYLEAKYGPRPVGAR
jgi:hypothetical protein